VAAVADMAAPPMKENSTIRQIEAGSGHDSALLST
jgi:hypothetical protein